MAGQQNISSAIHEFNDAAFDLYSTQSDDVMEVLSAMDQGDLTQKIEGHYEGSFAKLKVDTNQTVEKVTEVIGHVLSSSSTVHTDAAELA